MNFFEFIAIRWFDLSCHCSRIVHELHHYTTSDGLEHVRLDRDVLGHNERNYESSKDEPEDKVEPGVFIGEDIKE